MRITRSTNLIIISLMIIAFFSYSCGKKSDNKKYISPNSYRFQFKIQNGFSGYTEKIIINNDYFVNDLYNYPDAKAFNIYFITDQMDENKSKNLNNPVYREEKITLPITIKQSDSIFNLAYSFISNYKIDISETFTGKETRFSDGSSGFIMLGYRQRTIIAMVEELSDESNIPDEFKILRNYLYRIRKNPKAILTVRYWSPPDTRSLR
jgi:hypothetical protein